jgi:malate synthase
MHSMVLIRYWWILRMCHAKLIMTDIATVGVSRQQLATSKNDQFVGEKHQQRRTPLNTNPTCTSDRVGTNDFQK